ncbi:MAG: hypothetical protein HRS57_00985 [Mycoplasmataceae bacterium]|nr:hypothetical protein [Mycoplasmataceae bacterium]
MEPNKAFFDITIIEYSILGISISIAMIIGAITGIMPVLYASIAGFISISLYKISSYVTQIYWPDKNFKKFSFGKGFLSSMLRVISLAIPFIVCAAIVTYLPSDNTLTLDDTINVINLWILLFYISIPMISSFVYNALYLYKGKK